MSPKHLNPLDSILLDKALDIELDVNVPMSSKTAYRIGGNARYFARVNSVEALKAVCTACINNSIEYRAIGKGTNLLVSDEGFDGLIITLGTDFKFMDLNPGRTYFSVGAATILAKLVTFCFRENLAGFEWAVGIPGTIGGAISMNAGSGSDWICNNVKTVKCFSPTEGVKKYSGRDIVWGYRTSSIPSNEIVLSAELSVKGELSVEGREGMENRLIARNLKQPLAYPNCGSVFKNPEDKFAGNLIESVGLKGKTIGGAQISDVHGNFIVNIDNASAKDVHDLIKLAQRKVYESFGVELETEVKFIGL